MTTDTLTKAQLAIFAYHEANHTGSVDSMLAVCYVIRNRVRAGWIGGDWNRVLNFAHKHSAHETHPAWEVSLESDIFRRLLLQVDEIYHGSAQDNLTEKALYYCDPTGRAVREWFSRTIVQDAANHPRVAQVGMLLLFR